MKSKVFKSISSVFIAVLAFSLIPLASNAQRKAHHRHARTGKVVVKYAKPEPVRKVYRVVHVMPERSIRVVHMNRTYHFLDGVYYKRSGPHFIQVEAPTGLRIHRLPANHKRVVINKRVYYSHKGYYYQPDGRGYRIVRVYR